MKGVYMNNKVKHKGKFVRRQQPQKDSRTKRVNFDNTRESKFEKDIEKEFRRRDSNDIRWYAKNPALMEASARIPFAAISGLTPVTEYDQEDLITDTGVMAINYAPNFMSNPAVCMQAYNGLYSDIVHANSRNQSYDATDLAILMLAGVEVFSAIGLGLRAYGLMKQYKEQTLYSPRTLVRASGFDFDDVKAHYATMWSDLLQLIVQSRQIWIPNTMPLVERRFWMNTQVYTDSDNVKPQYYMYTPIAFYKYEGYTDTKGGKLVYAEGWNSVSSTDGLQTKGNTWEGYIGTVQSMIDALIPDQDRGIIYGDILKAYGSEGIFALNEIDLQYLTPVTYNREVLWQIENLTCASTHAAPCQLRQDTSGKLIQDWTGTKSTGTGSSIAAQVWIKNPIINFHQGELPLPAQVMVATRMTCAGTTGSSRYVYDTTTNKWNQDGNTVVLIPKSCGTELVWNIRIFYNVYSKTQKQITTTSEEIIMSRSDTISNKQAMILSQFDWHPFVYFNSSNGAASSVDKWQVSAAIGDLENWTKLDERALTNIHNTCLYSLMNIPTI